MILYSVIARAKDGAVLVESSVAGLEGNFPQITVEVLERVVGSSHNSLGTRESSSLLPDGARRTFVQRHDAPMLGGMFSSVATQWSAFGFGGCGGDEEAPAGAGNGDDDYYFHMCRKDNVICLCISDDADVRYHVVNYDFLDDVQAKFSKAYAPYRVTKAKAYEFDKKFRRELGKLMYFYNENRNKMVRQDKVGELLHKTEDLKGVLGRNMSLVLERETKLVNIVERAEEMQEDAKVSGTTGWSILVSPMPTHNHNISLVSLKVFTKRSSQLKTRMKKEYYSYYVIAVVFGVLCVYLLLGEACGYRFQCLSKSEGGR